MPLLKLLQEQRQFSVATFGPEPRLAGVLDHLEKELAEVQEATGDVMEWADCFLLCIDGSIRAGGDPSNIVAYMAHRVDLYEAKHQGVWSFHDITSDLLVLRAHTNQWQRWAIMAYQVWLAAYHHGHSDLIGAAAAKLAINQARSWPDWRESPTDQAIEHIKKFRFS